MGCWVQRDEVPQMFQAFRGLFGRVGVSCVEIDTDGGRVDQIRLIDQFR